MELKAFVMVESRRRLIDHNKKVKTETMKRESCQDANCSALLYMRYHHQSHRLLNDMGP